jgi:hypothetical protein
MQDMIRPRTPLRARWLEGLWSQRADHSGVELHWIRRAGLLRAAELASPN